MDSEQKEFDILIAKARAYLSANDCDLITRAYAEASSAHAGQRRASGEPYVVHPLATALILADMRLDAATLAAALLHDVLEDTNTPLVRLVQLFGSEVGRLVDGVTKLEKISSTSYSYGLQVREVESLDKMLLATANDIRVILIKLADRLHNMRTLDALSLGRRRRIAQETLDIYARLATRLGIWRFKIELEALALRTLLPSVYAELVTTLARQAKERARDMANISKLIQYRSKEDGIEVQVQELPLHLYDIYCTMKAKGLSFARALNPLAICVLVPKASDCYTTLGCLHGLWPPIPGQFADYIASPKENLYRSLHTVVVGPGGRPIKVTICTPEMQQLADYGVVAYWRYRDSILSDTKPEEQVEWLPQLAKWRRELGNARDFIESLLSDVLPEQIISFTPKGDLVTLPIGATALDFAYYIHTDVGHSCRGARVNGKLSELTYRLCNGDRVEIIRVAKKEPCLEWLDLSLRVIRTSRAKTAIRRWFRRQPRQERINRGYTYVEKECRRLGLQRKDIELVADYFDFEMADEFLAAVGAGDITVHEVAKRILAAERRAEIQPVSSLFGEPSKLPIRGTGTLPSKLAGCCKPMLGEPIIGYMTKRKSVTIHRADCRHVLMATNRDSFLTVNWDEPSRRIYPVHLEITAYDREGLLRDVSEIVVSERINMSCVSAVTDKANNRAIITATLEIKESEQLIRVLHKIDRLPNVFLARRMLVAPDRERHTLPTQRRTNRLLSRTRR